LEKYQYVREHFTSIQEIEIENVDEDFNFELKLLTSIDGKNVDIITDPYLLAETGNLRAYRCDVSGKNHSLALSGTFHAQGIYLGLKIDGRR
jgi:hypothetical protein